MAQEVPQEYQIGQGLLQTCIIIMMQTLPQVETYMVSLIGLTQIALSKQDIF